MEEQQQAPQGLSEADQIKIELTRLRKRLNQLEPRAATRKEDPNLKALLALKSANKDIVNVGWANSAKSAQAQLDKFPERFPDWTVREDEDIDGDGFNDTIIYNKSGNPKIINGQTLRKSQHPMRKSYYTAYPTTEERQEVNKLLKESGNPSIKQQYNRLRVTHNKDGSISVDYINDSERKEKLSAYKMFTKLYFNPIWDGIKHVYKDIATTEKLKVYGQLLRSVWQVLQVETLKRLGIPEEQRTEETAKLYSSKKAFKETIYAVVGEVLAEPINFAEATIMTLANIDQSLLGELERNMPRIIKTMRDGHEFKQ